VDQELVAAVLRQSHALEARLRTVRANAYASPRILVLLEATSELNQAIRHRFASYDPARSDTLAERSLERLWFAMVELRMVVLPAIEQGSVRARPIEVMLAIEQLFKATLDQEVVVLASPGELHEYAALDLWRRAAVAAAELGLEPRLDKAGVRFIRLRFSDIERDNVFLHCNLVHEIGHELIRPFHWDDELGTILGDDAIRSLRARVEPQAEFAALGEDDQALVMHELLARDEEAYDSSGVLLNWLDELLADLVALVILGPAAALAAAEWLNLLNIESADRWSRTHPRWSFRIDLEREYLDLQIEGACLSEELAAYPQALNYLESTQARHVATSLLPEAAGSESTGTFSLPRDEIFFSALEQALRNKFPDLIEKVGSGLANVGMRLSPRAFREEVPPLVRQLMCLIPPSTTGDGADQRPASYRAIVNAGAMVRFDRLSDLVEAVPALKADEDGARGAGSFRADELISALVRKAIADALIFERWQRNR
jgi:hypothetical protein